MCTVVEKKKSIAAINTAALSDLGRKFAKVAVGLNAHSSVLFADYSYISIYVSIYPLPIMLRNEDYKCRSYRY